jgi:hypothetical protein
VAPFSAFVSSNNIMKVFVAAFLLLIIGMLCPTALSVGQPAREPMHDDAKNESNRLRGALRSDKGSRNTGENGGERERKLHKGVHRVHTRCFDTCRHNCGLVEWDCRGTCAGSTDDTGDYWDCQSRCLNAGIQCRHRCMHSCM